MLLLTGCRSGASSDAPAASAAGGTTKPTEDWFTERAKDTGINFTHFNGMSGEQYYPEIMSPGVALLDYDNDGDLDVYLVQGAMLGNKTIKDAIYPPEGPPGDRLFRNDLVINPDGTRTLHFTDVTTESKVNITTFGMGVAVGDFDNDGFVDIYRTSLSGAVLLHNNGDRTFTDVSAKAHVANQGGWGVSAAFLDYDRDGWLDLFVGNYLIYSIAGDIDCLSVTGQHDYCPPNSYRAQPSHLYHNRGDGTFEDVTSRALIGGAYGPALGVSTADFNNDGWIDIYVGNDGQPNQLWINQKNGTFKETAFLSGTAVSGQGNSEASMGIDAGDFDDDGDEDLFITNWLAQMNVIYVNMGDGIFEDRRAATGLGPPSLARTGFGTAWFDYDNDSWLDLFTANGSVSIVEAQARAKDPFPLKMMNQLYHNLGNGRFEDVSSKAGKAFTLSEVNRGAAFGDIDNDGDVDVLVGTAAGPTRLLINNVGNKNHWLGLRLAQPVSPKPKSKADPVPPRPQGVAPPGSKSPAPLDPKGPTPPGSKSSAPIRDALGARVYVMRKSGPALMRRARSDGSYASANDPRIVVGLGSSADPVSLRVVWPDGRTEEFANVTVDRWTTVVEGSAK
ncbi:MAG TPA: FG-GAP-like repeat-containing protein [Vicinamibacterales bacterium]|nr:FG-GAP-like repeat-containing protein [Vicinamibacterales bacterium]